MPQTLKTKMLKTEPHTPRLSLLPKKTIGTARYGGVFELYEKILKNRQNQAQNYSNRTAEFLAAILRECPELVQNGQGGIKNREKSEDRSPPGPF